MFQRGRNRSGSSNDCFVIEDKKPEKRTAPITGIYQVSLVTSYSYTDINSAAKETSSWQF